MTHEEIIEKIRETLSEEFEVDIDLIQPDAPLMQTIELDSLDLVDMVVLIDTNVIIDFLVAREPFYESLGRNKKIWFNISNK